MSEHERNHRGGDEIEKALRGASFRPDTGFEDRLRARLIEKLPEPKAKSWWQMFSELLVRREDKERRTVKGSKVIGAFGFALVALMVILFVGLVLVRPSGMTSVGTEEPTESDVTPQPVGMIFGGELELVEASVEADDETWKVNLYWKPLTQPTKDYHIAVFATADDQIVGETEGPLVGADLVSSNSADWSLPTSQWQVNHLIHTSYGLGITGAAPEFVSVEVRDPESGWTLTLEYQGHSLSTVRAGVWSAESQSEVVEPQITATPPTPIAVPEIKTDGTPRMVTLSADGQWAAVESQIEGEWPQIHLHNLTSGEVIYVAEGVQPQISDDGKWLVFVMRPREGDARAWTGAGSINLYEIGSGTLTAITGELNEVGEPGAMMPAISADGQRITFVSNDNLLKSETTKAVYEVYLFDRVTTEMRHVYYSEYLSEPYSSQYPSITADGQRIAFQTQQISFDNLAPQVVIYDYETEQETLIGEGYAPQISADGSTVAYLRTGGDAGQGEGWINAYATSVSMGETRWLGRTLDHPADGGGIPRLREFSLSADGQRIAFWSVLADPRGDDIGAPPAVEGLGSAYVTTYLTVYDWMSDSVMWTDHSHVPPGSAGWINSVTLSAAGERVAFVWRSEDRSEVHVYWMALE